MFYLTDTHALIWYLIGRLPSRVDEVFGRAERGETIIYLPTVVLAECFYLVEHGKIAMDIGELLNKIEMSDNFIPVPFDFEILKLLPMVNLSEIHDRIIVATAKHLNAKLITKDKEITQSGEVEVVW